MPDLFHKHSQKAHTDERAATAFLDTDMLVSTHKAQGVTHATATRASLHARSQRHDDLYLSRSRHAAFQTASGQVGKYREVHHA